VPLIDAYDQRTGKRCAVPGHWLGTPLGAAYALTPPPAAPEVAPPAAPAPEPTPARTPRRGARTPEPDAVEVPGDPTEAPGYRGHETEE
jgi:hypothetical protein